MSTEPTSEGKRLIDEWQAAVKELEARKRLINSLECHMHNARNALGKWLMPIDAKDGEQFCIWYGDSLITATAPTRNHSSDYDVQIRSRGRALR